MIRSTRTVSIIPDVHPSLPQICSLMSSKVAFEMPSNRYMKSIHPITLSYEVRMSLPNLESAPNFPENIAMCRTDASDTTMPRARSASCDEVATCAAANAFPSVLPFFMNSLDGSAWNLMPFGFGLPASSFASQ